MAGEKSSRPKPVPGWQGEGEREKRETTKVGRSKNASSSGRRVFATQRHCRADVGVATASRCGGGGIPKGQGQFLGRREANRGRWVDDASMVVLKVATAQWCLSCVHAQTRFSCKKLRNSLRESKASNVGTILLNSQLGMRRGALSEVA